MRWLASLAWLAVVGAADPAPLTVTLDADTARRTLAAVTNPGLTREEALAIARLPGSAGLIRKIISYDRPADENRLADALMAAAHRRPSPGDADYRFVAARDAAGSILPVLDRLTDPRLGMMADVEARIARFTPPRVRGTVNGYVIVGGTSGGFAFGEPKFYLNLARFPSALLARTIMAHELYHGVQQLARASAPVAPAVAACRAALPGGDAMGGIFDSLVLEGTASLVGDVSTLPTGADAATDAERTRVLRGIAMVDRSVTLLGLSTQALATDPAADYDAIYALGFYGDEILYSLGHVMSRAIVAEAGEGALADLIDKPGAAFVVRYAALRSYGSEGVPKLDPASVARARAIVACG